jgi:hypothetical protein|tara:strand:+ start:638 stop:889 length:252 start_codon:yes stop_codon:yes gene_type:complete
MKHIKLKQSKREKLVARTDNNIRCVCGKLRGIKHFRLHTECDRCKTYCAARGNKGKTLYAGDTKRAVKSGKYRASKDGTLTGY